MTTSKRSKYREWMNTVILVLTFLAVVFGGYKGAIAWGEYTATQKATQDARMFKDAEQRIKTKNMVDAPYSKYKQLMARDSIIRQQKKVDTMQRALGDAFKSINERYENDSENRENRIASRNKRDSLREIDVKQVEEIKKDFSRMENAVQLILSNQQKILDTIN